jgi:4-hydroxythreonine-4-phosphate dehydrogenase
VPDSRPVAISLGDAAGIGPEIIAKAFAHHPEQAKACVVFGDVRVLAQAVQALPGVVQPKIESIGNVNQALELPAGVIPVWQVGTLDQAPALGQVSAASGRLAADCVRAAAHAALTGQVQAVVTAPLNKTALAAAGEDFPGHTEMLQFLAASHLGLSVDQLPVRMMLANRELRTVLVSIHVSLRQAIEAVTLENVLQTLRIAHASLRSASGGPPKLALAGLNPHAGEGGLMGREEIDILMPAIAQARALGMDVSGPFPPDTVFMRARESHGHADAIDAVVAMYHDQGLIPVKYLGLSHGVNVTLGLPFVRTSPDHGTAYDIAGQGVADPASLLAALDMARALAAKSI